MMNDQGEVTSDYLSFHSVVNVSLPASGDNVSCNGSVYSYSTQAVGVYKIYLYISLACNVMFILVVMMIVMYYQGTSHCSSRQAVPDSDESGSKYKCSEDGAQLGTGVPKDLPQSQKEKPRWR